jgi:hypothetical protein
MALRSSADRPCAAGRSPALGGKERGQVIGWNAKEVADPHMREGAAVAHPVHRVPAHAQALRDLRHGQEAARDRRPLLALDPSLDPTAC